MGKILIVSALFPPEPVVSANLSYDIAVELVRQTKETVVFSPKPSRPLNYNFGEAQLPCQFEHVVARSYICPESRFLGRLMESISFGFETSKYIKKNQHEIECIYANTWPLFAQLYLARTAKKLHIPYIIHVQDVYPESYCHKMPILVGKVLFKLLYPIDKYVLRNAERVIGISPSMVSYLSKSRDVSADKFLLVRNWQNDQLFIETNKNNTKKSSKINLMYLGSINPTANVTLIIEAISSIADINMHLSIIGNGPEKECCQDLAKKMKVNVTFETVTPDKVASKQSEADILILCLKRGVAKTATPSKLTAYMLSGRPIVASVDLDSDCANIIRKSGCGLVVEPDDIIALSNAIQALAEKGKDELAEMGRAAFNYAIENLSKERNLGLITDLLIS